MANTSLTDEDHRTQPVRVADLREVPLDELPGDIDCDDMVSRVLGRRQYAWRVDVASFDSGI